MGPPERRCKIMSLSATAEYLAAIKPIYKTAFRSEKYSILDEFGRVCHSPTQRHRAAAQSKEPFKAREDKTIQPSVDS